MIQRNSIEILGKKVTVNETPAINDIERFWDTVWSEEKHFNENKEWKKMYKPTIKRTRASME